MEPIKLSVMACQGARPGVWPCVMEAISLA